MFLWATIEFVHAFFAARKLWNMFIQRFWYAPVTLLICKFCLIKYPLLYLIFLRRMFGIETRYITFWFPFMNMAGHCQQRFYVFHSQNTQTSRNLTMCYCSEMQQFTQIITQRLVAILRNSLSVHLKISNDPAS